MPSKNSGTAALIIAGGRGTRFWPLSRGNRPKPLFAFDGRTTLLEATIGRLTPLVPRERIFIIVAAEQAALFRRALHSRIPPRNLLVEPEGRGTTMAIAYGTALIRKRVGETTVAVVPADHYVSPANGFRRTLASAMSLARDRAAIVVVGVKPTRAETGYGYQMVGKRAGSGFVVERFIEKPPMSEAVRMARSRRYLWNAGIFVFGTETLQAEIGKCCPVLADAMPGLLKAKGGHLARAYRRLRFDAFDRDVIERSQRVLGVRARFQWHDVGSWQGLWEAIRGRSDNVTTGRVIALDSHGVMARGDADGRPMVIVGMDDLVAIDAGDAILIARRSRSQELRRVTEELHRRGLDRFL
jgi:mannose-1-phosphate guanylyltransferase